jgi:hypothetical protein
MLQTLNTTDLLSPPPHKRKNIHSLATMKGAQLKANSQRTTYKMQLFTEKYNIICFDF